MKELVENLFNQNDYTKIHACARCHRGFIAKTKSNQVGNKDWEEYLCIYCGLNSEVGELVYNSHRFLDIPVEYHTGLREVSTDEERSFFQSIWLPSHIESRIFIDDSDYEPPRDPALFPLYEYLKPSEIERAKTDEIFDMEKHQKYIASEDGRRKMLNRVRNGDFGYCPFCGSTLYPICSSPKPYDIGYILKCTHCTYNRTGDADGVYFMGWIGDQEQQILDFIGRPSEVKKYVTPPESMNIFHNLLSKMNESKYLDFKEIYKENIAGTGLTDGAKKELRKDICALANNSGGTLFVGVKDDGTLVGLSEANISLFSQELLDQLVSGGIITPDIQGVRFHKIQYNNNWYVVITVPRSNSAPHLLNGKIPSRFGIITKYFDTKEEWESNIQRDPPIPTKKNLISDSDEFI